MVDGLLAKLGNGIVPLNCSSIFAVSLFCLARVPIRGTLIPRLKNSLTRCLYCLWIAKHVSLCPRQIPCIRSQASVAAQRRSRTWNDRGLTGNVTHQTAHDGWQEDQSHGRARKRHKRQHPPNAQTPAEKNTDKQHSDHPAGTRHSANLEKPVVITQKFL